MTRNTKSFYYIFLLLLVTSQFSFAAPPSLDNDIRPEIIRQLPSHLELVDLTLKNLEDKGNNFVPVYTAAITIAARTTEHLYTTVGTENGKTIPVIIEDT